MKGQRQYQLLTAAFCLLLSAFWLSAFGSSWTRQPSGTMAWLHAVYFLDQNRGWIAGSNGTLMQTRDGGDSWQKVSLFIKDTLQDVYFADEKTGWLLAERDLLRLKNGERSSYLLKTEDSGGSWQPVLLKTPDTNIRFVRLLFTDPQHGWLFGENGFVLATGDGGAHWQAQRSATRHLLLGGAFSDHGRGYLVGAATTIMQTRDGGSTWHTHMLRDGANLRLHAASVFGDCGWAVGEAGNILATTDSGRTWSSQHSASDTDLLDVEFLNPREGWIVGSQGTLLHTTDGGTHWTKESIETSHALERLFIADRDHIWAVGFGGIILKLGRSNAPILKP
jgi:photosystem II stability/assembly factor-like uncharacterized protein